MQSTTASYGNQNATLGVAGQLADTMKIDAISLQNSESAGVGFGLAVVDKGDGTFEDPDAATKKIRGVLLHSHAYDNDTLDPAGVPTKQMGDVLTRGKVVVVAEDSVVNGGEVFYRYAGSGTKGAIRGTYVAGETLHLPKAKFRSTNGGAGKAVVLELLDGLGEPDIVTVVKDVGALNATTTIQLGAVPVGRHVKVRSASLSCGVTAESSSVHWVIQVKSGSTVLASHDSDTAQQGAVTQNVPKAMVLASAAGLSLELLVALFTKVSTAADLTAGAINVELEVY